MATVAVDTPHYYAWPIKKDANLLAQNFDYSLKCRVEAPPLVAVEVVLEMSRDTSLQAAALRVPSCSTCAPQIWPLLSCDRYTQYSSSCCSMTVRCGIFSFVRHLTKQHRPSFANPYLESCKSFPDRTRLWMLTMKLRHSLQKVVQQLLQLTLSCSSWLRAAGKTGLPGKPGRLL